jgi:hypothetical protein
VGGGGLGDCCGSCVGGVGSDSLDFHERCANVKVGVELTVLRDCCAHPCKFRVCCRFSHLPLVARNALTSRYKISKGSTVRIPTAPPPQAYPRTLSVRIVSYIPSHPSNHTHHPPNLPQYSSSSPQSLQPLNLSNSLNTTKFASKNRSTHCLMHGSSYLSSLPFLMPPAGMHLRKHVSVRLWIAKFPTLVSKKQNMKEGGGRGRGVCCETYSSGSAPFVLR